MYFGHLQVPVQSDTNPSLCFQDQWWSRNWHSEWWSTDDDNIDSSSKRQLKSIWSAAGLLDASVNSETLTDSKLSAEKIQRSESSTSCSTAVFCLVFMNSSIVPQMCILPAQLWRKPHSGTISKPKISTSWNYNVQKVNQTSGMQNICKNQSSSNKKKNGGKNVLPQWKISFLKYTSCGKRRVGPSDYVFTYLKYRRAYYNNQTTLKA